MGLRGRRDDRRPLAKEIVNGQSPLLDLAYVNLYSCPMNTLSSVTVTQLKRVLKIREKIDSLQRKLAQIFGGKMHRLRSGRRKMSAATRAKIAAAQRARWAKVRGNSVKPKRKMSAATRAAISAAAKARWKKAKAAGKTTL
jgi:hypothetical protein